MDLLSSLSAQVKVLSSRQDQFEQAGTGPAGVGGQPLGSTANVPSVSAALGKGTPVLPPYSPFAKAANIVGPPPKVRGHSSVVVPMPQTFQAEVGAADPGGDPSIAVAISQQSAAVTASVAHLTNQADPLSELSSGGNLSSGVQRREKMQQDLANGSSNYYFRSESELSHISFLSYLQKTGGYRGAKEAGLLMWLIGYIIDAAAQEDHHQVKERFALLAVAREQRVVDGGDWSVAYLLSLAEDPPLSLYIKKTSVVSPYGKPFSSLVPSQWAAVILAYVKEMELLSSKKQEASPKKSAAKSADPDAPASPKRRTRFPKKPKADQPPPKS